MNVNLPDATLEFADVLRRALADLHGSSADLFATVDRLGVLDLLGADSADPANGQLNTVVALEQVARAGQRAPIAETIWLRGHGLRSDDGFVAIASGAVAGVDRLLPYGALARSMLTGSVGTASIVSIPAGSPSANIEIDRDHRWIAGDVTAPSFVALDQSFAWRAAAASTVGSMTRASEMAIEHARSRVQFGKPLASFQALQFRMAECSWRLLGLRLLVREAAWRADRLDPRADAVSALAWLYAREVGRIVTKHAHQVHGAIGFTRELGLTTFTGASATLRALYPAGEAAAVVRAARGWDDPVPPSTILGGFQQ